MTESKDPWGVDSPNSYSVFEFYTQAKYPSSESATIHSRIPITLHGRLARIVESGRIEQYSTISDMVRDAIQHRVHFLEENEYIEPDDTIRRLRMISRRNEEQKNNRDFVHTIEDTKAQINFFLSCGDREKALAYLQQTVNDIDGMSDEWWRSRFLKALAADFLDLLKQLEVL